MPQKIHRYAYSKSFKTLDRDAICNICQIGFGPTHYLIECSRPPNIRQDITQKLLPVHHSLPALDKARYIIGGSAITHYQDRYQDHLPPHEETTIYPAANCA